MPFRLDHHLIRIATNAVWAAEVVAPHEIGLSKSKLDDITALVQREVEQGRIAGAVVGISRHGRVGYLQAIGNRDAGAGSAMKDDSLFRIASMTKSISSAAILMLYEDGQLSLSDPISKYLPDFKNQPVLADIDSPSIATVPAEREPTMHELLTHTSGITYGWFGPEKLDALYRKQQVPDLFQPVDETIGDITSRIAKVPLKFQPGSSWDYGLSIDVLGRVVEVISGLTFEQFLSERFFRRLDMNDTHFYVPEEKLDRLSALYTPNANGKIQRVTRQPHDAGVLSFSEDYCYQGAGKFFSGGGGLVSTVNDYLRFLQMLANGGVLDGTRVLNRETVALMTRNQIGGLTVPFPGHGDGFGYGFGVLTKRGKKDDIARVGTYSWGGIFNTYFWVDPQEELIGVVMTQLYPYDHLTLRDDFKRLTYDAIDDSGFKRVYWYEKGVEHGNPFFSGKQLRVNARQASIHRSFATRQEPRSSGNARILIEEDLREIRRADLYCEL